MNIKTRKIPGVVNAVYVMGLCVGLLCGGCFSSESRDDGYSSRGDLSFETTTTSGGADAVGQKGGSKTTGSDHKTSHDNDPAARAAADAKSKADYSLQRVLSELIEQDAQEVQELIKKEHQLKEMCSVLYLYRTQCPLLARIISRRAPVVGCQNIPSDQGVIKVSLNFGYNHQGRSIRGFQVDSQIVLHTEEGDFSVRLSAGQKQVHRAQFVSDSSHRDRLRIVDVTRIVIQPAPGQSFVKEREFLMSLEVNRNELLFNEDHGFGKANRPSPVYGNAGEVSRYEISSLPVFESYKQKKVCKPDMNIFSDS